MADETIEQEIEATETDEKETGSDQNKNGKTFTQAEVNALIAKEKASWKRSADKVKSAFSETETTLRDQLKERDEVIQKNIDLLMKDLNIDGEEWAADFGDKDVLWQYNRLLEKAEKASKLDIPRTPKGTGERNKKFTFPRTNIV